MENSSIQFLFPYPVVYIAPELSEVKPYVDLCYGEFNKNQIPERNLVRGRWEGGYDILKNPKFSSLIDHVSRKISIALQKLYLHGKSFTFLSTWVNISPPHAYNSKHIHPGSAFSAVYYLQVPPDSGSIVFSSCPHRQQEMFAFSEDFKDSHKLWREWSYEPEPDSLIVFPSTLTHEVTQNKSKNDRISIAFTLLIE